MDSKQNKVDTMESQEDFETYPSGIHMGELGFSLSEMSLVFRVRRFFSSLLRRLPKMSWEDGDNYFRKDDSELETARRRYDVRGSVDAFTQRIWDAFDVKGKVGRLLRKQSLRTRKDEEVQRRQEEIGRRSLLLTNLSRSQGHVIEKEFFKKIESGAYLNLRFPEGRKEGVSLDYYVGFQNGSIWVVENWRRMIAEAVINHKKNAILNRKKRGQVDSEE